MNFSNPQFLGLEKPKKPRNRSTLSIIGRQLLAGLAIFTLLAIFLGWEMSRTELDRFDEDYDYFFGNGPEPEVIRHEPEYPRMQVLEEEVPKEPISPATATTSVSASATTPIPAINAGAAKKAE